METATLSEFLHLTKSELTRANADRRHPFRNVVIATSHENMPSMRTVVMRKFAPDFSVTIYTDVRSQKMKDLEAHPDSVASLLFWHPKKRLQIRMSGMVEPLPKDDETERIWKNVPEVSHISYITKLPPGGVVKSPKAVEYFEEAKDGRHFTILIFRPVVIDILQLNRELHLRAGFTLNHDGWSGEWLVP